MVISHGLRVASHAIARLWHQKLTPNLSSDAAVMVPARARDGVHGCRNNIHLIYVCHHELDKTTRRQELTEKSHLKREVRAVPFKLLCLCQDSVEEHRNQPGILSSKVGILSSMVVGVPAGVTGRSERP